MTTTVDDANSQTFEAVVLLYVAVSKLPDGDLDESEAARILSLTAKHTEGLSAAYTERVVADAAAALAAEADPEHCLAKVVAAAEHIAKALTVAAKVELVKELHSIVNADGAETSQEHDFVEAAARTFGVR